MTLQKQTIIDSRNILADGQIQVREATYIVDERGAIVAGPAYHRYVITPGTNLTNADPLVARVAQAEWTDSVVTAYQTAQQAQQAIQRSFV